MVDYSMKAFYQILDGPIEPTKRKMMDTLMVRFVLRLIRKTFNLQPLNVRLVKKLKEIFK